MDDDSEEFEREKRAAIAAMAADEDLRSLSRQFLMAAGRHRRSYQFTWLGLPIIQLPEDILILQELVWQTQPEVVVETGVARGGSVVFHASLLSLLGGEREVVGVDVDIRPHNRARIEGHPLARLIHLIEGSSIAPEVVAAVKRRVGGRRAVVVLDSLHTHDHVLAELRAYADLVTPGSYLVVLDTVIENVPKELFPDRPWGPGNNPRTAVRAFLREDARFVVDRDYSDKLLASAAPDGILRRVGQVLSGAPD